MPRSIVLATRNPGKFRELKAVLAGLPVELADLTDWALSVPEDGSVRVPKALQRFLGRDVPEESRPGVLHKLHVAQVGHFHDGMHVAQRE